MENFKQCPYCLKYFKESEYLKHLEQEKEEEREYKRKVLNGVYNFGYTSFLRAAKKG